jgi:hypothetical protein
MKPFYKATHLKARQCGWVLKVSYRDIKSFEIASIHWSDWWVKGKSVKEEGWLWV